MSRGGSNSSAANKIPYVFDRPSEPLFTGRDSVTFDVPTEFWPERYKNIAPDIQIRFPANEDAVRVSKFKNGKAPDLSEVTVLDRHANFSIFNRRDRTAANKLIQIFMDASDADQFFSTMVYARERVNPYLFVYAASVSILHRSDTQDVSLPSHVEIFPRLYMDNTVFGRAQEEASVVPDGSKIPIEVPRDYTGTDLDEEHRVAYFREDVGLNLHHWHWHLVYPFSGPDNIVRKDRRGEMLYYMHQQIMARYNFERLCNGLLRVRRMNNLRDPIPEAYFPKLDSGVASRNYPSRQPSSYLRDLNRETDQLRVDIADLDRWRDRILNAISDGYVEDTSGKRIQLTETQGIDILGNLMESSTLSVNPNSYGDLHNLGHILLAYIHDPDNRFLNTPTGFWRGELTGYSVKESFGPMGDPSTAMRDPVFYAWHANVNEIFNAHKSTLNPYTTQQLNFDGVRVTKIEVITEKVTGNTFLTFWQQNDINLSKGMDFQPRGTVYARLTHLQHAPFKYRIQVDNSGQQRQGTVRIFLGPRIDEKGSAFLFRDQRTLFIEMDKFTVNLKKGSNTIERNSIESNVTIPYEQTFRDLNQRPTSGTSLQNWNYCGCGWPDHLLVPRGTADGYACVLFVMVSDAKEDQVQQDKNFQTGSSSQCDDAQSYCGLRGGKYPDKKAMGYPFDRNPRSGVSSLAQFLTGNMAVLEVKIKYNNYVAASPTKSSSSSSSSSSGNKQTGNSSQSTQNQSNSSQSSTGNRGQSQANNSQSGTGNRGQNQGGGSQSNTGNRGQNQSGGSQSNTGNRNQGQGTGNRGGGSGGNPRPGGFSFVEDENMETN